MPVRRTLQILTALAGFLAAPTNFAAIAQSTTSSSQSNTEAGSTDHPKPETISPPVLVHSVEPNLPDIARRHGQSNVGVTVIMHIETDGKPSNVRAIRTSYLDAQGHITTRPVDPDVARAFEESAIDAVSRYKFKPARKKDGTPIRVQLNIDVRFQLF